MSIKNVFTLVILRGLPGPNGVYAEPRVTVVSLDEFETVQEVFQEIAKQNKKLTDSLSLPMATLAV
jgi:hypothetical protein